MLLTLALLASISGPMTVQETHETCLGPDQVASTFSSHNIPVKHLSGPELDLFNANYSKMFERPPPAGVNLLLIVEHGEFTQLFSFSDGCMLGVGKAQTALIHKMLNTE